MAKRNYLTVKTGETKHTPIGLDAPGRGYRDRNKAILADLANYQLDADTRRRVAELDAGNAAGERNRMRTATRAVLDKGRDAEAARRAQDNMNRVQLAEPQDPSATELLGIGAGLLGGAGGLAAKAIGKWGGRKVADAVFGAAKSPVGLSAGAGLGYLTGDDPVTGALSMAYPALYMTGTLGPGEAEGAGFGGLNQLLQHYPTITSKAKLAKYGESRLPDWLKSKGSLVPMASGSGRAPFALGDDLVAKVVAMPRGVMENAISGDYVAPIPELVWRSDDELVNVVRRASPADAELKRFAKQFQASSRYWGRDGMPNARGQELLEEVGLGDVLNYDALWGDFMPRNLGRQGSDAVLLDEGALDRGILDERRVREVMSPAEWLKYRNDVLKRKGGGLVEMAGGGAVLKSMIKSKPKSRNPEITAWHGSPHRFDKFKMEAIGTGEGAQAYGHGLYLAEDPDVGAVYRRQLSGTTLRPDVEYKGDDYLSGQLSGLDAEAVSTVADALAKDIPVQDAIAAAKRIAKARFARDVKNVRSAGMGPDEFLQSPEEYKALLRKIKAIAPSDIRRVGDPRYPGYLYKTDIPEEAVARMLDWDKPLTEQLPEVQELIKRSGYWPEEIDPYKFNALAKDPSAVTGADIARSSDPAYNEDRSEQLRKAGVAGIRYLDGSSRSAGQGSSNFVVFDPEMIRILERNGEPTGLKPWNPGEWEHRARGGLIPPSTVNDTDDLRTALQSRSAKIRSGLESEQGKKNFMGDQFPKGLSEDEAAAYGKHRNKVRAGQRIKMAKGGLARVKQALSAPRSRATEIVKEPGQGQWLTGSVERALDPLLKVPAHRDEALMLGGAWNRDLDTPEGVALIGRNMALNKWVEGPLTKYVKNRMATRDDEIRALAEDGVSHIDLLESGGRSLPPQGNKRDMLGFDPMGVANTPRGAAWENLADDALVSQTAAKQMEIDSSWGKPVEEWMAKIDAGTPIYRADAKKLGFDHILDVIREDLGAGRLRPENLGKLSVRDAVKRAAQYNEEKAKAMEAKRIADMAGIPVHKDYPDKGMKWVELRHADDNAKTGEWLKQEGDAMGHCVGGYCDDVLEGRTKIYSLRDAKGEPHVTVEIVPEDLDVTGLSQAQIDMAKRYGKSDMPRIKQIKGKQNLKPKDEYLPFVQDFVKSGKWSDVGDLQNSGLRLSRDIWDAADMAKIRALDHEVPDYITSKEVNDIEKRIWPPEERFNENFSRGGIVRKGISAVFGDLSRQTDLTRALERHSPEGIAKRLANKINSSSEPVSIGGLRYTPANAADKFPTVEVTTSNGGYVGSIPSKDDVASWIANALREDSELATDTRRGLRLFPDEYADGGLVTSGNDLTNDLILRNLDAFTEQRTQRPPQMPPRPMAKGGKVVQMHPIQAKIKRALEAYR